MKKEETPTNGEYKVVGQKFEALQLPLIRDVRGKDWVFYGELNLYPQVLIDLYNNSAMLIYWLSLLMLLVVLSVVILAQALNPTVLMHMYKKLKQALRS